jgi:2-aminoadipate transaminase
MPWLTDRLRSHGMAVDVETTLITSGSQQGIDLAARALIDPGTAVAVENPSYLAALQAFASYQARIVTVPSDDEGMRVELLEAIARRERVKVLYLVPCFQNPMGTTLALQRRYQLLDIASRLGIAVIEDDPYGELRFRGEHLPSLTALDTHGVVVRLGSFSKTLAPGLRLGYATGAREVIRAMTVAKQTCDLHTATLSQHAVARLLATFDYEGHLATLRQVYGQRCEAMLEALAEHMPAGTTWTRPEGGMFVWLKLPEGLRAEDLFTPAIAERVAFVPGSGFFGNEKRYDFMRLNFSNCAPPAIREGMERLGRVVARAQLDRRQGPPSQVGILAQG